MHFKPCDVIRFDFQENLREQIQKRGGYQERETHVESSRGGHNTT